MDFVAIDVETANADRASICQIGLAKYQNGNLTDEWKTLVNPEGEFDGMNVSIHGITRSTVRGAPKFPKLYKKLLSYIEGSVVVCHTSFDRVAVQRASARYNLPPPICVWLDSARVARRTWKKCARSGYGLSDVCQMLEYDFEHHDALADAKAAAHILLSASSITGLDLEGWLDRVEKPIDLPGAVSSKSVRREGNPKGDHFGEVLVFTGSLEISRDRAVDRAASIGCRVLNNVTQKTTMLVVGDQGANNSNYKKAETLISKGFPIKILTEADFKALVGMEAKEAARDPKKRISLIRRLLSKR